MANKYDAHDIVAELKRLCESLGKVPTRLEYERHIAAGRNKIRTTFDDNYGKLIRAAGIPSYHNQDAILLDDGKLLRQYKSICAKTEKIQGFFRHTLDLAEMFERAGNPKSLKLIAMPDTHTKFRDHPAVHCFLDFVQDYDPHAFLILGDFVDAEGVSHWPSESLEPRRLIPEIIEARKLLKEIVARTPNAKTRIFLEGNHSAWIKQALNKMPELFEGLDELGLDITLEKLLGLKEQGFELFELNHLVQIGMAHYTHGIYCGNNHAKKHLEVFKCNIFYGHLHDTQSYNQTSVHGPMVAQSLGCLCRLDAKFLKGKPNNWEHALGAFEFFPNGEFTYIVPRIINGRMSLMGKIYDGSNAAVSMQKVQKNKA